MRFNIIGSQLHPATRCPFGDVELFGEGGYLHGTLGDTRIPSIFSCLQIMGDRGLHLATLTGNLGQQDVKHQVIGELLLGKRLLFDRPGSGGLRQRLVCSCILRPGPVAGCGTRYQRRRQQQNQPATTS